MSDTQVRLLICGSRTYEDYEYLASTLDTHQLDDPFVIAGGAKGADTLGVRWAKHRGFHGVVVPAQWKKYGRSAGFRRNERMLYDHHPTLVVAFCDKPLAQSRGTNMMVGLAQAHGVEVEVHDTPSSADLATWVGVPVPEEGLK
jgi:hypothetical protein